MHLIFNKKYNIYRLFTWFFAKILQKICKIFVKFLRNLQTFRKIFCEKPREEFVRKSKIVNFSTTFEYNANNIACNFTKYLTKIMIK